MGNAESWGLLPQAAPAQAHTPGRMLICSRNARAPQHSHAHSHHTWEDRTPTQMHPKMGGGPQTPRVPQICMQTLLRRLRMESPFQLCDSGW